MKKGSAELPTHAHVRARPNEGVRDRVDELSRNSKVAELDISVRVDEDVGRFDVCEEETEDENEMEEGERVSSRRDRRVSASEEERERRWE